MDMERIHKNNVLSIKENIKDVILRPNSYKTEPSRYKSSFVGVEDCKRFYIVTICDEYKNNRNTTQLLVDLKYNILNEK